MTPPDDTEKTQTPRTDAVAEIAFNACNTPGEVVFADFARDLEREAAGLREALGDVLDAVGAISPRKAYELEGYGIQPARAEEIVRIYNKALAGEAGKDGETP